MDDLQEDAFPGSICQSSEVDSNGGLQSFDLESGFEKGSVACQPGGMITSQEDW